MVAVEERKESARRRAQVNLPATLSGDDAGVKLTADAEQQIQEIERTFTNRWEW
jgi:hypothetical protein